MSNNPNLQDESRFHQVDQEIAGVKKDIGGLQIEIGEVRGDIRSLNTGQATLQKTQADGFRDIKDALGEAKNAPAKISVGMLLSAVGVIISFLVVGVGAFWAAVMLLFSPLKEEIHRHTELEGHYDAMPRLVKMEGEVSENRRDIVAVADKARQDLTDHNRLEVERFENLDDKIVRIDKYLSELNQLALVEAREAGRNEIQNEWHSQWLGFLENQSDDIRRKSDSSSDAAASLTAQVNLLIESIKNNTLKATLSDTESAALKGKLEALEKLVTEIDAKGSRRWNSESGKEE